ncbi:hypothetical protein HPT25_19985 [Bacillus sp. BRMEA1]|uniref:hypothetical protein n=1 Tax=Neobacillus endophyticus TaxID=2738405 RepID=UPI001563B967|nr:hypothetical protein [Neobacillus endophyticus]NRD79645.1 hypothetical protein [Neobacillus endophyticus]
MNNDNQFSNFINDVSLQTKIENIWCNTCGSWANCNEANIQAFLSQCLEYGIDPQFGMGWVEQHKNEIPNWSRISAVSLDWLSDHSSTSSPITQTDENLS